MELVKNSVWNVKKVDGVSSGLYRVLQIFEEIPCLILFYLENPKGITRPIAIELDKFSRCIKQKQILEGSFSLPPHLLLSEEEIDESYKMIRDENFSLIEGLVSDPEFIFDYATRNRIPRLAKHANAKGKARTTISRLLNSYWRYGQNKDALLPAYQYSGGAGQQRKVSEKPLGAPKTSRTLAVKRSTIFIVTDTDKENIRKALKKHHLKPGGKNLVETRKELLREYYANEVKRAKAVGEAPYVPSYKQVRGWKYKLFTKDEISEKSSTEKDLLLNKRELLGDAKQKWPVPGSCFEIDATVGKTLAH